MARRVSPDRSRGRASGTQGFGYDPYFFVDEARDVAGGRETEQKRTVSHGGPSTFDALDRGRCARAARSDAIGRAAKVCGVPGVDPRRAPTNVWVSCGA